MQADPATVAWLLGLMRDSTLPPVFRMAAATVGLIATLGRPDAADRLRVPLSEADAELMAQLAKAATDG